MAFAPIKQKENPKPTYGKPMPMSTKILIGVGVLALVGTLIVLIRK